MDNTVACTLLGHRTEVCLLSSGRLNVGVDGWLVGAFDSPKEALFAAAEKLRQATGWGAETPSFPDAFRDEVEGLANEFDVYQKGDQ